MEAAELVDTEFGEATELVRRGNLRFETELFVAANRLFLPDGMGVIAQVSHNAAGELTEEGSKWDKQAPVVTILLDASHEDGSRLIWELMQTRRGEGRDVWQLPLDYGATARRARYNTRGSLRSIEDVSVAETTRVAELIVTILRHPVTERKVQAMHADRQKALAQHEFYRLLGEHADEEVLLSRTPDGGLRLYRNRPKLAPWQIVRKQEEWAQAAARIAFTSLRLDQALRPSQPAPPPDHESARDAPTAGRPALPGTG